MPRFSKAELIRLRKKFKTDAAIGRKFKITRQYVYRMRKGYDIPAGLADTGGRNEKIIALFKKGMFGRAIAKKFGLSYSMIYRIIRNTGASGKKTTGKPKAKRRPQKRGNKRRRARDQSTVAPRY